MKHLILSIVSFLLTISSCGKKDVPVNNPAPTNLTVNAIVNSDNSGNVAFTASATNAVSYDFDFGNGVLQTGTTGSLTYKYPASGTYTVKVIAIGAGGQSITTTIQVTVTVVLVLVWSDEFNTVGTPDASKWSFEIGDGCPNLCGWGNNELQWYTNRPENAVVQGGLLKITAIRESFSGKSFTSARMISRDKYSFRYGKIEVRAKLPAGVGTWPAIWMLGNNINTAGWPACGEIDIMEHRGSHLNTITAALHHPGRSGGNADGGSTNISNASTEFHKYGLEWNGGIIKFLVDDVVFYTFVNSLSLPFNQNFFIILNVAMGGNYGGPVDAGFTSAAMEVDYVRVYQ